MASIKDAITSCLKSAVLNCNTRGLLSAATWASEQLNGLNEDPEEDAVVTDADVNATEITLFDADIKVNSNEQGAIFLGSSLIIAGEYQRCAHTLQQIINKYTHLEKQPSKISYFLYFYSKYMAGEKVRTHSQNGRGSTGDNNSKTRKAENYLDKECTILNPFLKEIFRDMCALYELQYMDSYLLFIFAIVTRDLYEQYGIPQEIVLDTQLNSDDLFDSNKMNPGILQPCQLFLQSLAHSPWNWSCWLELSHYCQKKSIKIPTWEEICAAYSYSGRILKGKGGNGQSWGTISPFDKQCGRVMYAFFMSYVYLEKHRGDLALQAMEKLYRIFPTSLYLLTHVGVAYYSQRLYERAEDCFKLVRSKDPYRLQHIDTYSNILYVQENASELSMLAQMLITLEKYSPEVCCVIGNYYSLKGNHEKAVVYFQRAIRLDAQFVSAYTLMGHEYMELRNTSAAIVSYRQAIACNDTDFRAWYGLGQTYEMLHLYSYAYYYYQKATYLRPNDARMWSAVGNCLLKLSKTSEAMVAYERAVNCGDREGIATRDLAKLYKEERLFDKASTMYFAYLLCNFFDNETLNSTTKEGDEDENSDRQLSMPSDLAQLKQYFHAASVCNSSSNDNSPSSANQHEAIAEAVNQIWNHNFSPVEQLLDAEQAEALLYLANFFLQVQVNDPEDAILAEFFLSRLLSFTGPEGDEARMLLKELRSKQSYTLPSNAIDTSIVQSHSALDSPPRSSSSGQLASNNPTVSPLFSPWKRFSTHDTPQKSTVSPPSSNEHGTSNIGRYSTGSNQSNRMSTGSRDGYGIPHSSDRSRTYTSSRGRISLGSAGSRSARNTDLFDRFASDQEQSHLRRSLDDELIILPVDTSGNQDISQMSIVSNTPQ